MTDFWKKHYAQLVGLTILKVDLEEDEFGGDPWPTLLVGKELGNGRVDVRTAKWVTLQCDPEGNAAGFANIEPVEVPAS
jgi:hypothetical protein